MPPPGRHRRMRRGFALLDVIVAGMILSIGLSAIMMATSRALTAQTRGSKRLVAAWLCDELLGMVLTEGPVVYPRIYDMTGEYRPPFDEYSWSVDIEELGIGVPYRVTATVSWSSRPADEVSVETLIARRMGDPEQPREPYEPLDRLERIYGEDEEFAAQ